MGIRTKLGTVCGCTVYRTKYAYQPGSYEIVSGNGAEICKAEHPAGVFAAIIRALGWEV